MGRSYHWCITSTYDSQKYVKIHIPDIWTYAHNKIKTASMLELGMEWIRLLERATSIINWWIKRISLRLFSPPARASSKNVRRKSASFGLRGKTSLVLQHRSVIRLVLIMRRKLFEELPVGTDFANFSMDKFLLQERWEMMKWYISYANFCW